MEEVRIIKSIKYHIVNRYKIGEIWYKRDLCAYIATILYPFFDKIKYEKDAECLKRMGGSIEVISKKLNKKLKSLRNRHSELLESYSFDGLVEFFKSKLDDSILTSEEIQDAISLVNNIDESGYVSLNGADKSFDIIMNSYKDCKYLCEYGTVKYVNDDEENDNIIEAEIDETSNTPYNKNLESTQLDQEKKEIESKISKLYEYLVAARGGEEAITQFEYIWQWKISQTEYKKIKDLLCCDACKRNIKSISRNNVSCRLLVVIYIAERYKREWNGSDGNDNALEQIGLDNNVTKDIATKYFSKKQDQIYSSKSNYTEWLDSLRIEGGLPIYYIVYGDNNLSNFCKKLYQNEDEAINVLNNNTIKYSYKNGYSIFKYIDTIKKTDSFNEVFSEEDLKDELFIRFIKLLTEGRIESRKETNKFKYKYRVWTFQNEFLLHRSIEFKQDSNYGESKELISIDRIKEQWGVDDITPNDIFWLEVAGKRYEFHPWEEGFFRSDIGLTEFLLPTMTKNKSSLSEEDIRYIDKKGNDKKIKSIVEKSKDYIGFSSNNGYDWSTVTREKYSAILLLRKDKDVVGGIDVDKEIGRYRWIEYFDRIQIGGGKYIYSGNRRVQPKQEHSIINCSYVRSVHYYEKGERKNIYILDASKVEGKNFELVNGEDKVIPGERVKYKTKDMNYFEDYPKEGKCGFMRLDVDGYRFDAYILSHDAKISRKELSKNQGYIVVDGIVDVVEVEDCELRTQGWLDCYSEENCMRDSVSVRIKLSDEDYILFDVVRPLNRKDKIVNGHIVGENQDIPLKLKSQYKLRDFNELGVNFKENIDCRKPYSSNRTITKHNLKNFYYIAKGNNIQIEENLEFVFISSEGEETKLELSEQLLKEGGKDIKYLYFNNLPEKDGVIIQSLQNVMPELTYYEPCYINSKEKAIGNQSALDRLKLSLKHKLYFVELLYLSDKHDETIIQGEKKQKSKYQHITDYNTYKNEITPKLLIDYFSYYSENYSDNYDWSFLWDIADRLKVDWMMGIHQSCWKKFVGKDDKKKQLVIELFKSNSKKIENKEDTNKNNLSVLYSDFIDNYWDLEWEVRKGRGKRTKEYNFLQQILISKSKDEQHEFISIPNIDKEIMKQEIDELKQRLNTK